MALYNPDFELYITNVRDYREKENRIARLENLVLDMLETIEQFGGEPDDYYRPILHDLGLLKGE